MEEQIAASQAALEGANETAYATQLDEAQAKIKNTQTTIDNTHAEISKFNSLGSSAQAASLLAVKQNQLAAVQETLDEQLAEYQAMSDDLASNPLVQSDPLYAPTVQAQMAELGVAINATRAQMEALSQEVTYLTPLAAAGALSAAIKERQDFLASQEILLTTYQDAYIALQVSGKITTASNEVASLDSNLKLYQQIYLGLLNNRETLRLDRIQNMPNVVQANPSIATKDPVRPRTLLNTLLGGMAGLILALSAVLLVDFLDTTVKSREDVERAVGLPVLGYVLPMASSKEKSGPFVTHSPRSPAAEAFRSLRTSLEFIGAGKPIKSILVSSSGAGEGKTIIATNLALIMAQGGKNVVIIDADLRRPRLHQELGISNRIGLSDIFRGRVTVDDALQPYGDTNLSIITSGGIPPNPAELLASEMMVQILDELTTKFDMVVVDSTPTLVTDSQLIAARVDGVLLVVRAGQTQSEASRSTVDQYRRVGARLLGVILNNVFANNGYDPYTNYTYYHYDEDHRQAETGLSRFFRLPWNSKRKSRGAEE
jgi:capsular exopolysaccharide synthesis family protein